MIGPFGLVLLCWDVVILCTDIIPLTNVVFGDKSSVSLLLPSRWSSYFWKLVQMYPTIIIVLSANHSYLLAFTLYFGVLWVDILMLGGSYIIITFYDCIWKFSFNTTFFLLYVSLTKSVFCLKWVQLKLFPLVVLCM